MSLYPCLVLEIVKDENQLESALPRTVHQLDVLYSKLLLPTS